MNRILKKSNALIFCLAVILVLSTILPIQSSAATPTAKQNWKVTRDGEPLFEPLVQSNGALLFGNYKIVKDVYHTEIMNISTKGKISGKWSLKSDRVELGGTAESPNIIAINASKGIITAYSTTGKKLWSYNFKVKFTWDNWYRIDQNGNFYFFNKGNVYKVSAKGKFIYKSPSNGDYISPEGEIYSLNRTTLTKLSTSGKTEFSTKPWANDQDAKYLNDVELIGVTDNNIYLSARYYDESNEKDFYKLHVLNKSGELIKSSNLESNLNQVVEYNGDAYATGYFLYKLDSEGSIVKQLSITGQNSDGDPDRIYSLQITNKGEVYGSGENNVYKFNSSGDLEWKVYNKTYLADLFLFNEKQYVTTYGDKYVYIYDSKGKKISQISVGAKTGRTFLTADAKKKTVFVTNTVVGDEKTRTMKTTIISAKQ